MKFSNETMIKNQTQRLIDYLETEEDLVWKRCFAAPNMSPVNKTTGSTYTGLYNKFVLTAMMNVAAKRSGKAPDPRFLSMSKALRSGLVPNGKKTGDTFPDYKNVMVFFPFMKKIKVKNRDFDPSKPESDENKEFIIIQKHSGKFGMASVINVNDTIAVENGVVEPLADYLGVGEKDNPAIMDLDALIEAFPHTKEGESFESPGYRLAQKTIRVLPRSSATRSETYYVNYFHELAHQVGDMLGKLAPTQDLTSISYEELVAEFTASSVMAAAGYSVEEEDKNSAAYIKGWFSYLKDNPMALFNAANEAATRARYILAGGVPASKIKNPDNFPFLASV